MKRLAVSAVLIQTVFNFAAFAACEQFTLTASDAKAGDKFGVSVAIDGDIAVVGAYGADSNGIDSGAAYVFELSSPGWIGEQKLTPSDISQGDNFGRSVAIDEGIIVIGSNRDDDAGENAGSAYVFTRSGHEWLQHQKLTASDADAGDMFGFSVSVSGDTIVVGAYGDDDNIGSAYVFKCDESSCSQQQKLTASAQFVNAHFGYSTAIDNNTIIIGAYSDDYAGYQNAGSAYVFEFDGQAWTQDTELHASDSNIGDHFGCSVALDGNSAVIGAYECDINGIFDVGAAYIFERTETGWIQKQKLFNTENPGSGDDFGKSVAIQGNTVIVGCPNYRLNDEQKGAVFEFVRSGDIWIHRNLLTPPNADANDNLGFSAAMSGLRIIAGSHYNDDYGPFSGSAYILTHFAGDFDRNCTIDFNDFAVLSTQWLQNDLFVDIAPPPAGDGVVDIYDLALLCDYWLTGN